MRSSQADGKIDARQVAKIHAIRRSRDRGQLHLRNVINIETYHGNSVRWYLISYLITWYPLAAAAALSAISAPNGVPDRDRTASNRRLSVDTAQASVMTSSPAISRYRAPAIMTQTHLESTADPLALTACRNPRNCVVDSPDASDPILRPIPFRAPIEQVLRIMTAALAHEPRTRIVVQSRRYLRAEVRSPLFRFVDDVELLADENAGLIHFRSSSRIGRVDFGVNERRMRRVSAAIRQRLAELSPTPP